MKYIKTKLELKNAHLLTPNKSPGNIYWQNAFRQGEAFIAKALDEPTTDEEKKLIFKNFVCIVGIETTTYCNRKCAYCPDANPKYRRHHDQNIIQDEIFESVLNDLAAINYQSTISLNLYNEALASDDIFYRITATRQKLPEAIIKFNSNGDYLDKGMVEKLESAGLDALFITLHPGPNGNYNDKDRLKHLSKFLSRIDAPEFNLDYFEPETRFGVEFSFGQLRILVMAENWSSHGTSRGGEIETLELVEPRSSPCWRPWREFIVSNNGNVWPCCQIFPDDDNNNKYCLGNVGEDRLWEIYAKQASRQWRMHTMDISEKDGVCKYCSDPGFCAPSHNETIKSFNL